MSVPIFLLCLGMLAGYVIYCDPNVSHYIDLKLRLIVINAKRYYLMMTLHPRNPLTNYLWSRRMKKLMKEYDE